MCAFVCVCVCVCVFVCVLFECHNKCACAFGAANVYCVSGCSDRKVHKCSFYEVCESLLFCGQSYDMQGRVETESKGSCLFTHEQSAGAISQVAQI